MISHLPFTHIQTGKLTSSTLTLMCPIYVQIGKLILKGELLQAIDLIMLPRGSERDDVERARCLWKETRDAKQVLDKLPKSLNIERRLMQGVIRHGIDRLQSAMENIPRYMYVHYKLQHGIRSSTVRYPSKL